MHYIMHSALQPGVRKDDQPVVGLVSSFRARRPPGVGLGEEDRALLEELGRCVRSTSFNHPEIDP